MALAQDLMALGQNPWSAGRLATGGTGPVSIVAAGNSAATATQIMVGQFVVYVTSGTGGIAAPPVTGFNMNNVLIYDNYVIHNGTGGTITIYPPAGVTVNIGGSNITQGSPGTLASLRTVTLWTGPTSTQWFGLLN